MLKHKHIYVFLNKKLISCDTILPITLEIKKENPKVKINYITFDMKTYNIIKDNVNIFNLINEHSKFSVLGWGIIKKTRLLSRIFKILHIFKIIITSLLSKVINIHFKGLEKFPFSLIYFLNKKNTYLFDSNCWGENKNILFADYILHGSSRNIADTKIFPPFKNYTYLVAFDKNWYQFKYAEKNKKNTYIIKPSRSFPFWLNCIKKEAKNEILQKPYWYKKNKNYLVYVVGTLDSDISSIDQKHSGESLLKETLDIILKHSNYHILLKPHAITDISRLETIVNTRDKNRCSIVYNHIAVLSRICDIVLGNYFSQTMPDAWINGAKVIEYTKYDNEVLKYCNNTSVSKNFVDVFINYKPKILIQELVKRSLRKDRNIFNNPYYQTEDLIKKLSFRK